jgi:hypothetical protein
MIVLLDGGRSRQNARIICTFYQLASIQIKIVQYKKDKVANFSTVNNVHCM